MRTIRLYAHLIAPIGPEGVGKAQWRALWLCDEVALSLSRTFNGKPDCSSYDTIQYNDSVSFEGITDKQMEFILAAHPFIREVNKRLVFNH